MTPPCQKRKRSKVIKGCQTILKGPTVKSGGIGRVLFGYIKGKLVIRGRIDGDTLIPIDSEKARIYVKGIAV